MISTLFLSNRRFLSRCLDLIWSDVLLISLNNSHCRVFFEKSYLINRRIRKLLLFSCHSVRWHLFHWTFLDEVHKLYLYNWQHSCYHIRLLFLRCLCCQRAEYKFCVISKHKQLIWESSMRYTWGRQMYQVWSGDEKIAKV